MGRIVGVKARSYICTFSHNFFAKKTMASGYRPEYKTEKEKLRYIETVKNQEGIDIDPNKIAPAAGHRTQGPISVWRKLILALNRKVYTL